MVFMLIVDMPSLACASIALAGAVLAAAGKIAALPDHEVRVERDPSLDRSLLDLLALPIADSASDVDFNLQQAFIHCRALGIGGVGFHHGGAHEDEDLDPTVLQSPVDADVAYCHRIRYVRHVRQQQRDAWDRIQGEDSDTNWKDHPIEVRDAAEIAYQAFFETYAETETAVILEWNHEEPRAPSPIDIGIRNEDPEAFVEACFDQQTRSSRLRILEDECKQWIQRFQVPAVAANNYIPRTNVSGSPSFLPTLLSIGSASAANTEWSSCPFGLHSLFRPMEPADTVRIHYRVYLSEKLPHEITLIDEDQREYSEASISADASIGSLQNGQAQQQQPSAEFMGELTARQSLFVPGGKYRTVLGSRNSLARVLRFCFVDGSNFNRVTEALRVDGLVSSVGKTLFLSLQAPTFDTRMTRRPSSMDTQWNHHVQWPKESKRASRRDQDGSRDGEHLSRRERLKLWQDDKRWERHIESLTLPVPLAPVVLNTTRTTATLRFQDLYERPKNDITEFGYEVRWALDGDLHAVVGDAITPSGAVNITHKQLVRSAMPTTLFGDDFDGKDIEAVVTGLHADTPYTFTVRLFVGDAFGVESERSYSARTAAPSAPEAVPGVVIATHVSGTCVHVRWLPPVDDGGRHIIAYAFALRDSYDGDVIERDSVKSKYERIELVAARHAVRDIKGGPFLLGQLCNQIPGRAFSVRAAAVNAIGYGPWSKPSERVATLVHKTPSPHQASIIRGRGELGFVLQPSSHLGTADTTVNSTDNSPILLLSDINERLVVNRRESLSPMEFEVWTGHHSPRKFDVNAQFVLADPFDASQPLRNADQVRDRLLVVARGRVPFAVKLHFAQQAGALGVVIADLDGVCRHGFDQRCVSGSSKAYGTGFGSADRHPLLRGIVIPFVLALQDASKQLVALVR